MSDIERNTTSYNFHLPKELIATEPLYPKENARLLVYERERGSIIHSTFGNLFDFIPRDFRIILNDTKVIKARFYAFRIGGDSKREFLYHEALDSNTHLVQIKGRSRIGDCYALIGDESVSLEILHIRDDGLRLVRFCRDNINLSYGDLLLVLQKFGEIPLPPYMKRKANSKDEIDYQSIFASKQGALAAPTASLHFSPAMYDYMKAHFKHAFVTLHVGAGTFKGVSTDDILEHKMHSEHCIISNKASEIINSGDRILCVGTTAARSVEWFAEHKKMEGKNDIFLNPFNRPKRVNALLTNFHLPQSSLIMLVSSMIGLEETIRVYKEAIELRYRFYSYGDGMLIL